LQIYFNSFYLEKRPQSYEFCVDDNTKLQKQQNGKTETNVTQKRKIGFI